MNSLVALYEKVSVSASLININLTINELIIK